MVRYLLSNSGSAPSLRHQDTIPSSSIRLLGHHHKFASFDSDLSTLSAASLISSSTLGCGGVPGVYGGLAIPVEGGGGTVASKESGPIPRALCKNCSYVFLCAYSPSGPDFCSMDCRTSFDLHTVEEESLLLQQQHAQQQQYYQQQQQQQQQQPASYTQPPYYPPPHPHHSGIWDEPPAVASGPNDYYPGHGSDGRHYADNGRADADYADQAPCEHANPPATHPRAQVAAQVEAPRQPPKVYDALYDSAALPAYRVGGAVEVVGLRTEQVVILANPAPTYEVRVEGGGSGGNGNGKGGKMFDMRVEAGGSSAGPKDMHLHLPTPHHARQCQHPQALRA